MGERHFSLVHTALFGFLASMMICLMILLFAEYRFFCQQAKELIELKQQYAQYVDILNKKINGDSADNFTDAVEELVNEMSAEISEDSTIEFAEESPIVMQDIMEAEASDAPDDDDEYADDSFVVINRQPEHLKQSSLDFIESQDFSTLMTSIDVDRWSNYSTSDVVVSSQKKIRQKKSTAITTKVNNKLVPKISAVRRPIKECGFIWPIDSDKFWLSSLFGPRKRLDGAWGFHHGIDMAAVKGTLVKSARAGTVVEASFQTGYGNTVVVQHTDILKTRYAHLHTIRACVGQKIKQGAIVGTVGETGFIRKKGKDGSHLHFEVYEHGKRINPMHCLPSTM